ncbi:hypothetical protein B5C34_04650 [Pacificimonas flava]|uniref:Uncharacterized protein n=1 Tax=Pacificimonas flava TaxID=1234595 RepID=A0A219B383_9SPHN|nr:hypothetical protein B5C34_04650 [Pacificimonas flava]
MRHLMSLLRPFVQYAFMSLSLCATAFLIEAIDILALFAIFFYVVLGVFLISGIRPQAARRNAWALGLPITLGTLFLFAEQRDPLPDAPYGLILLSVWLLCSIPFILSFRRAEKEGRIVPAPSSFRTIEKQR